MFWHFLTGKPENLKDWIFVIKRHGIDLFHGTSYCVNSPSSQVPLLTWMSSQAGWATISPTVDVSPHASHAPKVGRLSQCMVASHIYGMVEWGILWKQRCWTVKSVFSGRGSRSALLPPDQLIFVKSLLIFTSFDCSNYSPLLNIMEVIKRMRHCPWKGY